MFRIPYGFPTTKGAKVVVVFGLFMNPEDVSPDILVEVAYKIDYHVILGER